MNPANWPDPVLLALVVAGPSVVAVVALLRGYSITVVIERRTKGRHTED